MTGRTRLRQRHSGESRHRCNPDSLYLIFRNARRQQRGFVLLCLASLFVVHPWQGAVNRIQRWLGRWAEHERRSYMESFMLADAFGASSAALWPSLCRQADYTACAYCGLFRRYMDWRTAVLVQARGRLQDGVKRPRVVKVRGRDCSSEEVAKSPPSSCFV